MFAFTQDVPIGREIYARIIDALGPEPLKGQLLHLVVERDNGQLRYFDVWESREAFMTAMDTRIHPAVDAAFGGARPGQEPTAEPLTVVDLQGAVIAAAH
ncbi:MAG: hypothetical protein GC156_00795 [Actinomycetales bacterium]|nr:hypothetical protein [Actinomycetales bacterium]